MFHAKTSEKEVTFTEHFKHKYFHIIGNSSKQYHVGSCLLLSEL